MTEPGRIPDPREPLDADALAEALEALQSGEYRLAGDESRLAAARRLMDAPRPVMRPEANARIEAALLAAAHTMPAGMRQAPPRRRVSWPLAAAAALVLALAAVLVPELAGPSAASPTPTPSATLTATPSATPTLTLTPTETPTETPTGTPTPAEQARPATEGQDEAPVIDCANPPPDNAPALGWRERCEGAPPPDTLAPGRGDSPPANPPGQDGGAPGRSDSAPGNSGSAPGRSNSAPGRNRP